LDEKHPGAQEDDHDLLTHTEAERRLEEEIEAAAAELAALANGAPAGDAGEKAEAVRRRLELLRQAAARNTRLAPSERGVTAFLSYRGPGTSA